MRCGRIDVIAHSLLIGAQVQATAILLAASRSHFHCEPQCRMNGPKSNICSSFLLLLYISACYFRDVPVLLPCRV